MFKRAANAPPVANGVRITKSLYGAAIPVWYGRTRGPVQLIWTGNFQKHTQGKKGKGGITYSMNADMLLGFGPMQGVGAIWYNTAYFQGLLSSQNFTTGTGTTFSFTVNTFPAGTDLTIVIGVVAQLPFSVSYNDYGGPGVQSFSGSSLVALPNQLYPAPNSGDWQNAGIPYAQYNSSIGDTNVTVVFPTSVSSIPITVYYMDTVREFQGQGTTVGIFAFEKQLGSAAEGAPIIYPDFSGIGVSNLDLGSGAVMPNISFEGYGLFSKGATGDANPADIVADIICSGNNLVVPTWGGGTPPVWQHGLNFTSLVAPVSSLTNPAYSRYGGILDDEPNLWGVTYGGGNNQGLNSFRNFCQAYGINLSQVLDTQSQASQWLDTIFEITTTAACWDGAQLKIIPYCEVSQFGNGASFVAPTAAGPIATFTDDDYIKKAKTGEAKPPLICKRARPSNDYNSLTINFTDRANGRLPQFVNGGGSYNQNSVLLTDQVDVTVQGPVPGTVKDHRWIHDKDVATVCGQAILRRNVIVNRRSYQWSSSQRFGLLSLMDLVLLTEKEFPNSPFPVRLTKITENEDYTIDYEAEPFIYGGSAPVTTNVTAIVSSGSPPVNLNVDPGSVNAPIIFEAVPAISSRPQLWICTSGIDPNYGGCHVWLSTDGGSTYSIVARQYNSQTMGKVYSSNYPSHADPDNANTLNVDLTESIGVLSSFSTSSRDLFQSLCYLSPGGTVTANGVTLTIPYELVAYATATLSATSKYALPPTIRRGVYGTPIAAHNIGQDFSFILDGAVVELNMLQSWIGVTLHFKFTAFNIFGTNEQALSAVTDYTFTPSGNVGWTFSTGGTPPGSQPFPTGGTNPSSPPNLANDMYMYRAGTYSNSQELTRITPSRNVTLPVNLTASVATCDVAPAVNVTVTINKNGASVGTVNFAAGSTTGTFTFASSVSLNGTGDVITLVAPSTADVNFAGASITLWATRSN